MTNQTRRRLLVGTAITLFAAETVAVKLIVSDTVAGELLDHWLGHVAVGAMVLAVAFAGLHLLDRAYRR
jgi:hypothetical protein